MAFDEEGRKIQVAGEGPFVPRRLDGLSAEEMDAYIGDLQAEIERVRTFKGTLTSVRTAADSMFKF